MSTKPASHPVWGTNPAADLVEPGTGRRALGFAIGERPLAGHLNQLLREYSLISEYVLDGVFTPSIKSPAYLTDTVTPLVIGAAQFEHVTALPTPAPTRGPVSWLNFTHLFAWVPLTAGQRVRAMGVRCARGGAPGTAQASLSVVNDANDLGDIITTVTIPSGGTGVKETISSGAIDYTIPSAPDTHLVVSLLAAPGSNLTLYRVVLTWDRPVV